VLWPTLGFGVVSVVVVHVVVEEVPVQVVMVVVVPVVHVSMLPVALFVVVHVVEVPVLMAPGAGGGALLRNPVSFTKANPDAVPVPVSNVSTGTSEELRRLLPTTY